MYLIVGTEGLVLVFDRRAREVQSKTEPKSKSKRSKISIVPFVCVIDACLVGVASE